METKRQLDVLDKKLEKSPYISGEAYTIADMAIFPWYGGLVLGELYGAAEFLDVEAYTHLKNGRRPYLSGPPLCVEFELIKPGEKNPLNFLSGTQWMILIKNRFGWRRNI